MKEKISVQSFVEEFVEKRIMNNKINNHAVEDFILSKLEITEYLPFNTKREIVDMIVSKVVTEEDGVKHIDGIAQFLAFIVAMVASHTTLVFSDKPEEDYDALSKCGVLEHIITLFKKDADECDVLLKIAVADAMADNNLNVIVGKFLNGVLGKMDGFVDVAKVFVENIDVSKLLGTNIKEEDATKIIGFIDKLNK
jgi:hypothetical protein